jgi:hypothetical protein
MMEKIKITSPKLLWKVPNCFYLLILNLASFYSTEALLMWINVEKFSREITHSNLFLSRSNTDCLNRQLEARKKEWMSNMNTNTWEPHHCEWMKCAIQPNNEREKRLRFMLDCWLCIDVMSLFVQFFVLSWLEKLEHCQSPASLHTNTFNNISFNWLECWLIFSFHSLSLCLIGLIQKYLWYTKGYEKMSMKTNVKEEIRP